MPIEVSKEIVVPHFKLMPYVHRKKITLNYSSQLLKAVPHVENPRLVKISGY